MIIKSLVLGVICILLEFVSPGIGIFSLLSLIAFSFAVNYAAGGTLITAIVLSIAVVGIGFLSVVYLPSYTKTKLGKLFLNNIEATTEKGYVSNPKQELLIGKTGVTSTVLRPSGIAEIDGNFYDVVTEGVFIEKNVPIEVIKVEIGKIVVRKK